MVQVAEPSEESAIEMVRGLLGTLEGHHKVRILDEAISAAVRLSMLFLIACFNTVSSVRPRMR